MSDDKFKRWDFENWFHAQFGARGTRIDTDAQLLASFRDGIDASKEMSKREEWDAHRKAALAAWHEKEKK